MRKKPRRKPKLNLKRTMIFSLRSKMTHHLKIVAVNPHLLLRTPQTTNLPHTMRKFKRVSRSSHVATTMNVAPRSRLNVNVLRLKSLPARCLKRTNACSSNWPKVAKTILRHQSLQQRSNLRQQRKPTRTPTTQATPMPAPGPMGRSRGPWWRTTARTRGATMTPRSRR